jgi:hypothetical protein
MHYNFDLFFFEDSPDRGAVAEIDLMKRCAFGDGGSVPINQVIEDHGTMAGGRQLADAMTADVTGPSGD